MCISGVKSKNKLSNHRQYNKITQTPDLNSTQSKFKNWPIEQQDAIYRQEQMQMQQSELADRWLGRSNLSMRTCSSFGTLSLRKTEQGSFLQVNDVSPDILGVRSESKLQLQDKRYKSYTMNWVKHLDRDENINIHKRNNKLSHMELTHNNTNSTQDQIKQLETYTTKHKEKMVLPNYTPSIDSLEIDMIHTNEHDLTFST